MIEVPQGEFLSKLKVSLVAAGIGGLFFGFIPGWASFTLGLIFIGVAWFVHRKVK